MVNRLRKQMVLIAVWLIWNSWAQAMILDDFESGAFDPGWAATSRAVVQFNPGNASDGSDYYAVMTNAAENGDALGAWLGRDADETCADFSIAFDFRFTDTNQRQMNIQIGPSSVAVNNNTGSNICINFAYDGVDNRFEAYNGSWQPLTSLPTNLPDNVWHRVVITGRHFGTNGAQYDITVNGITQTGITYFHGAVVAQTHQIGGFNFNDRFGDNPGFDVDNVKGWAVLPPAVSVTETAGGTKVFEAGETSDTFSLSLTAQPKAPVTVTLKILDHPDQVNLDKTVLTYTPDNFRYFQVVTVTAIDDAVAEARYHNVRIGFSVTSADPDYHNMGVADLPVTVVDDETGPDFPGFSGIYPHLAVTNNTANECGIGAIVAWAGSLWYVTYSPHAPAGSSGDKLYQLRTDLEPVIRPESIGGTPANRMIHPESDQLIISNYLIDGQANVRTIPFTSLYGRMTANARHLTDPANKVYYFTMEDGLYEVDVNTLAVTELHRDRNRGGDDMVPGDHGKGAYSGQGRLVVANNGLDNGGDGTLSEWNGVGDPDTPSSWVEIDRNQYTEVTGPGGIYGNLNNDDPLWSLGWDHKSVLLQVCDNGAWKQFRLPKGSYTQDDADGWYTEWPRIREAAPDRLMMDMHCLLYEFPITFRHANTAGIMPLSSHLTMIVDWEQWNDRLVLACNDVSPFGSSLLGGITQSNLRFTSMDELDGLGRPLGWGGPWVKEPVAANQASEPFLINGFTHRVIHFAHTNPVSVTLSIELDRNGDSQWVDFDSFAVGPAGYGYYLLPADLQAQWIRFRIDTAVNSATVFLYCSTDSQKVDGSMFRSLADSGTARSYSSGILHPINSSDLKLEFAADIVDDSGNIIETGYYVVGQDMKLARVDNPVAESAVRTSFKTRLEFSEDDASVIVGGFRLPKSDPDYASPFASGWPRGIREVVTERNLMNIHGTFYEYPTALDGTDVLLKIRPITTHHKKIFDFCSWRGMLVLSGNFAAAENDVHYVPSTDGKTGLWFGNVDDLFALGVPGGWGGPWKNTPVLANNPSDPYLMTGYDHKRVSLSHNLDEPVTMTIQVDFLANGTWCDYGSFVVPPGQTVEHVFPDGYQAHWVRLKTNKASTATAWFVYNPPCDGSEGLADLVCLARQWLSAGCGYCEGVDLTLDGRVNLQDWAVMALHWLQI